jgi:hypothetical protein
MIGIDLGKNDKFKKGEVRPMHTPKILGKHQETKVYKDTSGLTIATSQKPRELLRLGDQRNNQRCNTLTFCVPK